MGREMDLAKASPFFPHRKRRKITAYDIFQKVGPDHDDYLRDGLSFLQNENIQSVVLLRG